MKYIEFCAGVGGMRAGLEAAGWQCMFAVDNDADAVAVHTRAHGHVVLGDVHALSATDLPDDALVWVAGFPCQPFSSSGHRLGFGDRQGTVFEKLASLMADRRPPIVLVENVEGLLTNKGGHTFAVVLLTLAELGYDIDWMLLNLRWFGHPQTRPRLFLLARRRASGSKPTVPADTTLNSNLFLGLLTSLGVSCHPRGHGWLTDTEAQLRPAVGKRHPRPPYAFGPVGGVRGNRYDTFDFTGPAQLRPVAPTLAEVVAPLFRHGSVIRSARYWTTDSGRGPTRVHLRQEASSHCIGTSIGGAPLYAVPTRSVKSARDRNAFLQFANWHREEQGLLVMRLRPERALHLFGPYTASLVKATAEWPAGDTRKYRLVGNMVAPICAKAVADVVENRLLRPLPRELDGSTAR